MTFTWRSLAGPGPPELIIDAQQKDSTQRIYRVGDKYRLNIANAYASPNPVPFLMFQHKINGTHSTRLTKRWCGLLLFLFFFSAFCLLSFLPPFSSSRILPWREGKALNKLIHWWVEHWLAVGLPLKFLPFFAFASMGLRLASGVESGNSGLGIDKKACLWIA